jgi:putative redox protein
MARDTRQRLIEVDNVRKRRRLLMRRSWAVVGLVMFASTAIFVRIPASRGSLVLLGVLAVAVAAGWGAGTGGRRSWMYAQSRPSGRVRRLRRWADEVLSSKSRSSTPRTMRAEYESDDKFSISIGGHQVAVDESVEDGGTDSAPTPVELFVASLAACMAITARRYLSRHGIPPKGLRVEADFAMSQDLPRRVGSIRVRIRPPAGFPRRRAKAMLAVVERCTVHNSISESPAIRVELDNVNPSRHSPAMPRGDLETVFGNAGGFPGRQANVRAIW